LACPGVITAGRFKCLIKTFSGTFQGVIGFAVDKTRNALHKSKKKQTGKIWKSI